MSKFKVDDPVELVNLDNDDFTYEICSANIIGNKGTITRISQSNCIYVDWDNGESMDYLERNLKLIEETKVGTTLEQQAASLRDELDKLDVLIADKAKADVGSGRAYTVDECGFVAGSQGMAYATGMDNHYINGAVNAGRGFKTKEAAKRFVKYEKLCNELRLAQIESYGDSRPDWVDDSEPKWCVIIRNGRVVVAQFAMHYKPIHFKLEKEAYAFKNSHSTEDLTLLERGIGF